MIPAPILFADAAYDRLKPKDKAAYLDFVVEIIRRSDDQEDFHILPRRTFQQTMSNLLDYWRQRTAEGIEQLVR